MIIDDKSVVVAPLFILLSVFLIIVHLLVQTINSIVRTFKSNSIQNQRIYRLTTINRRRSIIKWGIRLGIAAFVGVLWDKQTIAFAQVYGDCPNDEACDCGPNGAGPWSGNDCEDEYSCWGKAGQKVPIYVVCDIYCWGSANVCSAAGYFTGDYFQCPDGPGC